MMKLFKPNGETFLCGAADTKSVLKQRLCKKFPSCHISLLKLSQTMQHRVAQLWDVGQQERRETSVKSQNNNQKSAVPLVIQRDL